MSLPPRESTDTLSSQYPPTRTTTEPGPTESSSSAAPPKNRMSTTGPSYSSPPRTSRPAAGYQTDGGEDRTAAQMTPTATSAGQVFLSPRRPPPPQPPPHESKISSPLISVSIRDDYYVNEKKVPARLGVLSSPTGPGPSAMPMMATGEVGREAAPPSAAMNESNRKRAAPPMPSSSSSSLLGTASSPMSYKSNVDLPTSPTAPHHATSSLSLSSPSSSATKRPYIRTKRPKNYSDRSTLTSTTNALYESHVHPYDAVLAEANDLLGAASEAQHLGRVKLASTYLLLLHARLVGLGRRFDKTSVADDDDNNDDDADEGGSHKNDATATSDKKRAGPSAAAATAPDNLLTPKSRAVKELTKLLPKDIQMDQAMMEHLAKAAVELHAARTKKSHHRESNHHHYQHYHHYQHNHHQQHMTAPPLHPQYPVAAAASTSYRVPDAGSFLATTANRQGIVTAATAVTKTAAAAAAASAPSASVPARGAPPATSKAGAVAPKTKATTIGTGIAWTDDEIRILNRSRADSMSSDQLASLLPGRTEQQVKTYLKNQNERQRVQLETMESLSDHPRGGSAVESVAGPSATSEPDKPPEDMAAVDAANASPANRARKPTTTAIYTAPNAICDARALLSHVRQQAMSLQQGASSPPSQFHATPSGAFDK